MKHFFQTIQKPFFWFEFIFRLALTLIVLFTLVWIIRAFHPDPGDLLITDRSILMFLIYSHIGSLISTYAEWR